MMSKVPAWKLLVILFGVALLCLGQLFDFITFQQQISGQVLGLEKTIQYVDHICGNGTKKCLSEYHLFTFVRNDFEKETLVKPKKKLRKRLFKGTKQGSPTSNEGKTQAMNNVIKVPSKEFIAWNLGADDTQVYMFNIKGQEDPNISGFKNANPIQDVERKSAIYVNRNSDLNRRRKTSSPLSDSAQENEATYWREGQLYPLYCLFYIAVGFGFGLMLGLYLKSLMNFICNYFILFRGKKPMRPREREKLVVDSNLNLADLPFNVEEFLIKKLDVRYPGQRFYGWQKIGEAFHVQKDDLRYLQIEYKRDNGSPTSKLFEMLGKAQNKKVSDLAEVLRSLEVRGFDFDFVIELIHPNISEADYTHWNQPYQDSSL